MKSHLRKQIFKNFNYEKSFEIGFALKTTKFIFGGIIKINLSNF